MNTWQYIEQLENDELNSIAIDIGLSSPDAHTPAEIRDYLFYNISKVTSVAYLRAKNNKRKRRTSLLKYIFPVAISLLGLAISSISLLFSMRNNEILDAQIAKANFMIEEAKYNIPDLFYFKIEFEIDIPQEANKQFVSLQLEDEFEEENYWQNWAYENLDKVFFNIMLTDKPPKEKFHPLSIFTSYKFMKEDNFIKWQTNGFSKYCKVQKEGSKINFLINRVPSSGMFNPGDVHSINVFCNSSLILITDSHLNPKSSHSKSISTRILSMSISTPKGLTKQLYFGKDEESYASKRDFDSCWMHENPNH